MRFAALSSLITWTKKELGKRSAIERNFGRVFLFFHLQRPPLVGWSAIVSQVTLTYTATLVVAFLGFDRRAAGQPLSPEVSVPVPP